MDKDTAIRYIKREKFRLSDLGQLIEEDQFIEDSYDVHEIIWNSDDIEPYLDKFVKQGIRA